MPQPKLLHLGMQYVLPDVFPPATKFTENDVPDQKGRTILITGASSGLGYRQAEVLLSKGARVYVTARAQEKADKIASELAQVTGNKQVYGLSVELGDPESIKSCAKAYLAKEDSLDCLVNNGGAMHTPQDSLSKSGHELQFASNVLGPWLLTQLLLPALEKAASAKGQARVVWLSSFASKAAPKEGVDFSVLDKGTDASDQDTALGSKQYGQSKLANILLSKEMAKRYGDKKILSVSLHPGVVESPLWRNSKSLFGKLNAHVFSIPISDGTLTQIYASTSPDLTLEKDNGAVLTCIARKGAKFHKMQDDEELANKAWSYCEKEYGKFLASINRLVPKLWQDSAAHLRGTTSFWHVYEHHRSSSPAAGPSIANLAILSPSVQSSKQCRTSCRRCAPSQFSISFKTRMGTRGPKRQPGENAQRIANLRKGLNEFGEPLTHEEDGKRKDLLERNRLAAKRCRSKRKNQQLDLEAEGRRLTESNEELQVIVAELRAEVEVLRQLVQGHQPQGCHAGGLPRETIELLSRPLPEVVRSPSKASEVASSMSSPMASGLEDLEVLSPPILSAPSIETGKRGHQPSSSEVQTPIIDPSLLSDAFHSDFSFIHTGAHGTPNGRNIDISSLLRPA